MSSSIVTVKYDGLVKSRSLNEQLKLNQQDCTNNKYNLLLLM